MLTSFADLVVYQLLNLDSASRLGQAAHFFVYDSTKIFFLLAVIIYVVSMVRTFLPRERIRSLLTHRWTVSGNILAALLGVITPFCSCSAVPLFIGFVESGIPLGVTFSFLISSPMVNEVAMVLLWGLFGWKIALLYIGTGVGIAIFSGVIIGRLHLERYVQDYIYESKNEPWEEYNPTWPERFEYAYSYTGKLLKKIWPYILIGIGVGGFIHGYAPSDFLARTAGRENIFAVPLAVLVGVPLYSNAAGVIPVVQSLIGKGLPMGTALAFMMAVTALSFPEAVILNKVLKPTLLAIFFGIVAVSIIAVGYLFNAVL